MSTTAVRSALSKLLDQSSMKFLFACHHLVASGGLLRFERVGHVLRQHGHSAAYAVFSKGAPLEFSTALPILTFEAAAAKQWDAVFVPGAGFPDQTIDAFKALQASQFGIRVQMILNDQHLRSRFLRVNSAFSPHIVIFNNEHWVPGSFQEFKADRFHTLVGAVDTTLFRSSPSRSRPTAPFVIGAQISKNPAPLIEALNLLPFDCKLRFFGFDRLGAMRLVPGTLAHRVEYVGPLFGEALAEFYRSVNAIVSTEVNAGWANVIAEAMASGVPVVTTPAGTLSIARHEQTALVVQNPAPLSLAIAIEQLKTSAVLADRLVSNARLGIERYTWQNYTAELLNIVQEFDGA